MYTSLIFHLDQLAQIFWIRKAEPARSAPKGKMFFTLKGVFCLCRRKVILQKELTGGDRHLTKILQLLIPQKNARLNA
jgi:hypothetical protein